METVFPLVRAEQRGRLVVGRFETYETTSRDGSGKLRREQRIRPELEQCPDGLAVQETKGTDGQTGLVLGDARNVKLPPKDRKPWSEVYEGEQQAMESDYLILRRRKGADGRPCFDVQVADDWFTFSKATTVSRDAMDMDMDEVEKQFELSQRRSTRRSRLTGTLARLAARKGTELVSAAEEDAEATLRDAELAGASGSIRTMMEVQAAAAASGTVRMGRMVVRERFTRVQHDDDERFDDGYRAAFQQVIDEREGKQKRRLGYSGIHGADREVDANTAGAAMEAEDDAEVLGDFDEQKEQEEAIFTQFDDDDDAAMEAAVLQEEEGTGVSDAFGAETLAQVLENLPADEDDDDDDDDDDEGGTKRKKKKKGDDDDDDEDDEDAGDDDDLAELFEGDDGDEDEGPTTLFGGARMAVAQRRRMRQARAQAAANALTASSSSSAAAAAAAAAAAVTSGTTDAQAGEARKRSRPSDAATAATAAAGRDASEVESASAAAKRSKGDIATRIERNARKFFVEHGGKVTARAIGKFVGKLGKRYGEAAQRLAPAILGRLAVRRGGTGADSIWELRPDQWKNAKR